MQENIEFSCMLQRPRLISPKLLGDLSLATIRGGASNFLTMGLKYIILGTIKPEVSKKVTFHLLMGGLACSDGGL